MTPGHVAEAGRLERLEDCLTRLRETAAGSIVVVEGDHDLAALDALGVGGRHVKVHAGRDLQTWMDALVEQADGRRVVLLPDWDRTGGRIFARLREGLKARTPIDTECRRRLAAATHCRCLEHVPGELASLRQHVAGNRP